MRRQILNVKLLALVVGLGGLLGGGGYLVYRLQVSRTARALLREAELAEAKGDYGRAEHALGRYLAIRPGELVVPARHGLVLDRQGTNPRTRLQAFLAPERVLRRDPGLRDIRRRLVDLAMGLGRYNEARTHVEILQKSVPRDSALAELRGQCEEAVGAYNAAAPCYEKAIVEEPRRRETSLRSHEGRRVAGGNKSSPGWETKLPPPPSTC
jgi:tetratricopeptide (TPR) repeat protein